MFEIIDGPEESALLGSSVETDQPIQVKAYEAEPKKIQKEKQVVSSMQTSQNGAGRSQSSEPIKS